MNEENKEEVKEEQVTQEASVPEAAPTVEPVQEAPTAVAEPTPPEKKNGKTIIIVMGLIILLLIGVVVFLLLNGDKKNSNSDNKETNNTIENNNQENTNNENNNNNENNENNNNNSNNEQIIEPTFAAWECGGINFTFQKASVLVNDMKASDKLGMLATVLTKMVDTSNLVAGVETEIDIDIYEIAKKYFDLTPEMEEQMGDGFGTGFLLFSRKSQKSFVELIIGGCIGPDSEGHYVKHKESKTEGNTLISTYYYYYKKNDDVIEQTENSVTQFPYSYYKSASDTTPVYKEILNDDSVDFDKFDTYDLYFDISDGNTKLIKIVYNAK